MSQKSVLSWVISNVISGHILSFHILFFCHLFAKKREKIERGIFFRGHCLIFPWGSPLVIEYEKYVHTHHHDLAFSLWAWYNGRLEKSQH